MGGCSNVIATLTPHTLCMRSIKQLGVVGVHRSIEVVGLQLEYILPEFTNELKLIHIGMQSQTGKYERF